MTILPDAEPAFTLSRLILKDPAAPNQHTTLACDILAQSPDWPDQMLAREVRTGFWSSPHSEHGDNFNRRHAIQPIGDLWAAANEGNAVASDDAPGWIKPLLLAVLVAAAMAFVGWFATKAIANAAAATMQFENGVMK